MRISHLFSQGKMWLSYLSFCTNEQEIQAKLITQHGYKRSSKNLRFPIGVFRKLSYYWVLNIIWISDPLGRLVLILYLEVKWDFQSPLNCLQMTLVVLDNIFYWTHCFAPMHMISLCHCVWKDYNPDSFSYYVQNFFTSVWRPLWPFWLLRGYSMIVEHEI